MKILEKIIIPQDNVNDEKVIVKNIYVEDHSKIEKGDILIDYETSKANFELTASQSGYVKILINEGESVEVGKEIILIGDEKITDFDTTDNKTKKNIPSASKKALELIRENNLDSRVFSDFSLVTEKVVLEYLKTNKISNSPSNDNVYELSPNKLAEIDNLSNINRNGLVSYVLKTFECPHQNGHNSKVFFSHHIVFAKVLSSIFFHSVNLSFASTPLNVLSAIICCISDFE